MHRTAVRWPGWPAAPTIVAEALVPVVDPLTSAFGTLAAAPSRGVAAAIAALLLPDESPVDSPSWLLPTQRRSFRRAIAALERFGGCLLADPVGSGKSYIALAIAATLHPHATIDLLVPATLVTQWHRLAARLAVAVRITSHARLSRSWLPGRSGPLIIIDESHHFRHAGINRYRTVAPWVMGRQVLLLTATPAVNRLADVAAQLLLGVPDDALTSDGVPSLCAALEGQTVPAALERVIVQDGHATRTRITRTQRSVSYDLPVDGSEILQGIDGLALSSDQAIAALVRGGLWRALASSPAAIAAALRRYRRLLCHALDAGASGRRVTRQHLRAMSAPADDQLVMWSLLGDPTGCAELVTADLPEVARLAGLATRLTQGADPKAVLLERELADGRSSLVFTCAIETVRHLRARLNSTPVAWCTGAAAGIGHHRLSRTAVLGLFDPGGARPGGSAASLPQVLLATDVAAEGLDLQLAERVIHYDLPWTSIRIDQREGRSDRIGAAHDTVETVRFLAPPAIERRLAQEARLALKAGLPRTLGLGPAGRWRDATEAADRWSAGSRTPGVILVRGDFEGMLAGVEFRAPEGPTRTPAARLVAFCRPDGSWSEDPRDLHRAFEATHSGGSEHEPSAEQLDHALGALADRVRHRLRQINEARWQPLAASPDVRTLLRRLRCLGRRATRCRDVARLGLVDRSLQALHRAHTAGEVMVLHEAAGQEDAGMLDRLSRLPARPGIPGPPIPRLVGLIIFRRSG